MKLTPITIDEVIEEACDDYCADSSNPLTVDEWIKTEEADQSIKKFCLLLGIKREQV